MRRCTAWRIWCWWTTPATTAGATSAWRTGRHGHQRKLSVQAALLPLASLQALLGREPIGCAGGVVEVGGRHLEGRRQAQQVMLDPRRCLRGDHHQFLHLRRLLLAEIARGPVCATAAAQQHDAARLLLLGIGHGGVEAGEDTLGVLLAGVFVGFDRVPQPTSGKPRRSGPTVVGQSALSPAPGTMITAPCGSLSLAGFHSARKFSPLACKVCCSALGTWRSRASASSWLRSSSGGRGAGAEAAASTGASGFSASSA
ncbi:hypothetical protein WR25_11248 [Diploscapter pachys]|uniref:Secreted protein n=1 Tax=Diploscapter pachys TaxID=2018661 RepID=A0A2A2KEY4_9BILA|nr:hypothetical protein WR25_11248 [Diploscapter pachys]